MVDYKSSLHGFLEDPVEFKKGNIKTNSRAKRIVNKATEVMVKITGNAKGEGGVALHLDYISRDGELKLETETGEVIKTEAGIKEIQNEWNSNRGKVNKNTRETTNIILSMPFGTDEKGLGIAAREFAKKTFAHNYQYVFVLHNDSDGENPHVHLTVKNLGYDNKRLHVKKGQPQEWRESFAEELRKQGIEAEATPRSVRGVVKKGINQAVKYIRVEKRESFTDKAKIKEVVNEYENKNSAEKPWESKIKERQNIIRRGWLNQAKDLKEKGEDELSKSIVNFVQEMPPLKTERHEIKEHIAKHHKEKSKDTKNNEQEER